mgnify:FL=1
MAFDYKFYLPPKKPQIIEIPAMNFVSVCGRGDPNEPDGAYQRAIQILYGIAFTIKMSCKGAHKIDGYFSYVVPPLEGLWQQEGIFELDTFRKEDFQWRSMIRLPDFVEKKDFDWAVKEAEAKKKTDFSAAEFFAYEEGLCVQCMHIGSYGDEPETIRRMDNFAREAGYQIDVSGGRMHHEIYLSDPRRTNVERLRTVVRHPVTRMTERVK